MYSIVAVAVAMCLLLPISIDATIDLDVDHRSLLSGEENNVRLQCENTTTATFYRMDSADSEEQELSATTVANYNKLGAVVVTFLLEGATEGLYFCRSGGDDSPKKKLVAYPPHLQDTSSSRTASWASPFTVVCPYNIGVLREQYTMEWTVIGADGFQTVTTNSSDYQLVGSSLIISNFTPFIERLTCTLTVRGTEDFPLAEEKRHFNFHPITIEPGNSQTTITQAPSDTRAKNGTAEFECVASVPQNREVEFEIFGGSITTNDDISCTTTRPSFTQINCNKPISNHSMVLSCDYSTGYQISCLLRVDNLEDSDSSDVTCRILKGSTIEANRTAKLLQAEVPTLTPTPIPTSTVAPTSTIPTVSTTDSSSVTPSVSASPSDRTVLIVASAGGFSIALLLIVLLILVTIMCYVHIHKRGKHKIDAEEGRHESVTLNQEMRSLPESGSRGNYTLLPNCSPQRSISPSDQGDGHSYNPTEFTQVPSSQESTPSHRSHSSINHSHNSSGSRCTCNCHDRNSYGSAGHLEPPKTLQLARYGYPDADVNSYPHHHYRQYSEEQYGYVPGLKVIPPTPNSGENTPGTEPFSVPSPVSPGLQRPSHIKFNAQSTQESVQAYASTPVSGEVAVNIAMYLMHKDCPDQENCPTCQLINRQFQHLLTRYEHAHSKDIKREKLRRRRSVRGTPKSLHPPKLGRQRSQSTSEVNAEELTMSSNEDSSTDAEVLTEPEGPRSRTFVPLPLSKIPRDLLASDSELAVTPSGHIPSPRRTLASPTKIHLKSSTPQSPAKDDRPPSSDSLTTSESSGNSRPGSEGYDLPLTALPLPITRGSSYSAASGYETMTSSDNDSVMFLPNRHHPRNNIPLSDTEVMMHRRRQPQPNRHTRNKKPNHSATRSTHSEFMSGNHSPRSRLETGYGSQSNESFNSAKSDMVPYSHHTHYREDIPRPSSSSPCRSRPRDSAHAVHLNLTLPRTTSQQTDL